MTAFDAQRFIEHLKTLAPNSLCPICKSSSWTVLDKVFELHEYHYGETVFQTCDAILPVISIICKKCGFTHFINPLIDEEFRKIIHSKIEDKPKTEKEQIESEARKK